MSFLHEYKYRVMVVYIVGLFMQIVDGTVVNIAIPSLADEFEVDATEMDWAVIGYYLALVVVIPIAGFLGDRYGTKRMFLIALSGFTIASAVVGAAQTLEQLIAFRMMQGLFAGLITPIGSAMLFRAFPLAERAKASAAVITVAVVAPAIGPTMGGIIVDTLSWRWIFYMNVPIGGLGLLAAFFWLKEEKVGTSGRIDWAGVILSASGLGLVLFGLLEGPRQGWDSPVIIASLIIGALALIALVIVETHIDDPVLALRLFRNRLFRGTNAAGAPIYAAFFSFIFLLPIFLQEVGGHSAARTGFTVAGQALGVIISSQLAGRWLYPRFGPRILMMGGASLAMIVSFWFTTIDESTSLIAVALGTVVRGLAMGILFISLQTATFATIGLPDMGRATSLFSTQRQASITVGVAIVATLLSSQAGSFDDEARDAAELAQRVDAFQLAFGVSALLFGLGAVMSIWVSTKDARPTMGTTEP